MRLADRRVAARFEILGELWGSVQALEPLRICDLAPEGALVESFAPSGADLGVFAILGCVQLGTGCLLMTAASRHLSATELGLLALLEPILGPLECGC